MNEKWWILKVCIENSTCFYFNNIIKLEDFDIDNILIDGKPHKNILIWRISCKTLISSKPLRIRFDKINEFVRIYDGTTYLTLLGTNKYDAIYDRIRYLITLKISITYIFSHYFAETKVNYYDSLPIEKILTLNNVITLSKSALNKDKYHCYHKIFLEKCSCVIILSKLDLNKNKNHYYLKIFLEKWSYQLV